LRQGATYLARGHFSLNSLKYATFVNANRADINTMFFQNYLKPYPNKTNPESDIPNIAIVIKAINKMEESKPPLTFHQGKVLFQEFFKSGCET
jgi:hypothetical protein